MNKTIKYLTICFLISVYSFRSEGFVETHKVNTELQEVINVSLEEVKQTINTEIKSSINENLKINQVFKKRINPNNVKSISYLLASGKGFGKSSFGHSYLRISYHEDLKDTDDTIEFVADATEEEFSNFNGYLKGVGLDGNYGIKIAKAKYSKIREYHSITEDRDLTSYILDLNEEQKNNIIEELNTLLVYGTTKKYAFFSSNCADVVSKVINAGLDKKITGMKSVIPSAIPSQLKKLNLIKDEHVDSKKSDLRKVAVDKKYPKVLIDSKNLLAINLKNQLKSMSLKKRVAGFYKLQLLRKDFNLRDSIRVTSLVNSMIPFESRVVKYQLTKLFSTRSTKVETFSKIIFKLNSNRRAKVLRNRIRVYKDKVYLETTLRQGGNRKTYKFHLKELNHRKGVIVDLSGKIISVSLGKELAKDNFFHPSTYIHTEVVKNAGKKYLVSVLVSEKKSFRDKIAAVLDRGDQIAYKNGDFNNVGIGMCFAHSELSQKLEVAALFAPDMEKLSSKRNLKLIENLYQGKIVVVPGFKNGNELTASMEKSELGKIMYKRHQEKYSAAKAYLNYFDETSIDENNFYILKNLLTLGINPIIAFRISGSIGHSVLISKIIDKGDHYSLIIIDPNMTYQENIYKFNKVTGKLDTYFYGVVDVKLPYFDIDEYLTKVQILNMEKTKEIAIESAKELNTYSFWPSSFFKF